MKINKKQFATSALLLISNLALGFFWNLIPHFPLLAIFALLSGVAWVFFAVFADDRWIYYIISAISILLLGVGMRFDGGWLILGLLLGMIFSFWAFLATRRAYNSNIKFSLRIIAGSGLRTYFTAIAVVFSLAYFGAALNSSNISSLILSEQVFNLSMKISEKPLQAIVPGISSENTVDEALALFVQAQLKQTAISGGAMPTLAQIRQMIPSQRKEIIRTLNKELGTTIDINTKGTEKLSSVLYKVSANKIDEYAKQFSSFVPWILAIGFFFSLKAISFIYYYASIVLSSIFIKILLSLGVLKLEKIPAEKEVLV